MIAHQCLLSVHSLTSPMCADGLNKYKAAQEVLGREGPKL